MSNFVGDIIEESLENKEILKKIKITSTRVEKVKAEHKTPWLKRWTLRTVTILENEAKAVAEKLSTSLDRGHGGSWYADFKNNTHHYVIFRDKVFYIDRKSKEQYDEARKYGISLGIPEYQLINYQNVPLDFLAHFLAEANKNTYAKGNTKFEKDGLSLHDTYFGERNFIGEEIVYKDRMPMWGMNYFGFVLNEKISEKDIYGFLRRAIVKEYESLIPVRGPAEFKNGDWQYRFSVTGDLANFSGKEEILFKDGIVYKCLVHGGFIE